MTEKEKLNAVLQKLYELRDDGNYHDLAEIMVSAGFHFGLEEERRIAENLRNRNLIRSFPNKESVPCRITSEGIEYVENSPVAPSSSNSFGAISIFGSTNVNVILASSHVITNQNYQNEALKLINQFKEELKRESTLSQEELDELKECIEEIENKIQQQKKVPKFVFDTLLSRTANWAALGSLAIEIGKVLELLPK